MKSLDEFPIIGWNASHKKHSMLNDEISYLILFHTLSSSSPPELAGFASYHEDKYDNIPVLNLAELQVAEKHRGRGVGSWMIREVELRGKWFADGHVGDEEGRWGWVVD